MLVGDFGVGEQLARLIPAGGIADPRRSAAHQHDRPVAGLLQPAQQHDRDQAADVQAGRSAVEADVGGDRPLAGQRVERFEVGALVQVAALDEGTHERGTGIGHRWAGPW